MLPKGTLRQDPIPTKPRFRWNTSFPLRTFSQSVLFMKFYEITMPEQCCC